MAASEKKRKKDNMFYTKHKKTTTNAAYKIKIYLLLISVIINRFSISISMNNRYIIVCCTPLYLVCF